jgi:putative flippase GtrA
MNIPRCAWTPSVAADPLQRPHELPIGFGGTGRAVIQWIVHNRPRLLKWFAAGLAFMGVTTGLLYVFVEGLGLPVPLGTLVTAEACTLLRFLVNHYWVFGQRRPTWKQCLQYHVANAGAFATWWVAANLLTYLGLHYLIAGIAAVAFSTLVSLMMNFFWVWGKNRLNG